MPNAGLIARMLHALDEFDANRLSSEQVELAVDFHMQGLEQIGLREIHEARCLTRDLVRAHCSVGMEEFIDVEQVPLVVKELRRFLKSLPDGSGTEPYAAAQPSP